MYSSKTCPANFEGAVVHARVKDMRQKWITFDGTWLRFMCSVQGKRISVNGATVCANVKYLESYACAMLRNL